MAYAAPPVASTKETTNYARLCRLLVDIGTEALRDTFNAIYAPANLHAVLSANKATLQPLRNKKVINPIQWGKLFPVIPTAVSSRDFDTTLLMVLLRNICGLIAPLTGWDALPAATDLSREADLVRIKHYRNIIYGHAGKASVDDITFNDCWRDIRDTLVRLGGVTYAAAVDSLKDECMDPQVQDHYKELLSQWKKHDDNVIDLLQKIIKKLDAPGELMASTKVTFMCEEPNHENEPLQHYCEDCNVCICLKCGQTNHTQHSKVDMHGAAEEKKIQRRKMVNRAKANVAFLEAKVNEQRVLMNKNKEEVVAAQNKVTETVEQIIGRLREHEAEIKTKLTEINETQQRKHTTRLTDLQLRITRLNASIEYDEGVLQKSNVLKILHADDAALSLREEGLNVQEIKLYKPRHVNYILNQEKLNLSGPMVLGKVVASHTDTSKSTAEGQGLTEAELGVETNFKVTTRDSQGNQFYDKNDQLQVIVKICSPGEQNENEDIENIEDCKDGSYTVRYKPKTLGLHDIIIEVNGQPLTCSPWNIQVTPHRYTFTRSIPSGVTKQDAFVFPWSIALNERTEQIAIAGYHNKCIQLFDSQGKHFKTIGGSGLQKTLAIGYPLSVAFLRNNDLIFTHERNACAEQMSVYTARGPSISSFSEHVVRPLSVFVKTEGDGQVVVSDVGDRKIKVLSPDLKDLLQSFSSPDETAEFVFHKNGSFFATYQRLHSVKVFNDEGVFLYDIGSFGSGDGQLNHPIGLAVDAFNQLIVCDYDNQRVQVFTLNGEFLYSITNEAIDNLTPWFVTVSSNSEILVSDVNKDCVYVFR